MRSFRREVDTKMGFKEGLFVLVFIAIAAPFAFKITSSIQGFKDEAVLGVVFLFYAIDAFLSRSGDYFPAAAIQQVGAIGKIQAVSKAQRQIVGRSPPPSSTVRGPYRAGSFSLRRR